MSQSPLPPPDEPDSLAAYLLFVSDMLGGDLFPVDWQARELNSLVSHRAIDYELIHRIVREIRTHNAVTRLYDRLEPWDTLDALGKVRGELLKRKGDINQISLIDRIGELTVSFFNLAHEHPGVEAPQARVYSLRKR